ncbi:hypothetical protein GCM10027091_71430 [Streptomyces daliensis]
MHVPGLVPVQLDGAPYRSYRHVFAPLPLVFLPCSSRLGTAATSVSVSARGCPSGPHTETLDREA